MIHPLPNRSLPVVAFHCTRCGACCNSAPQLSLPELLVHQETFVGCLSVRRVARLAAGSVWQGEAISPAESAAVDEFAAKHLYVAQGHPGGAWIQLTTQAYDEESRGTCPALTPAKLCSLEGSHKPLGCRVVPLEAWLPDALQPRVLGHRATEAAYMGANCISMGSKDEFVDLLKEGRVADPGAQEALRARRETLALERKLWGDTVFRMLSSELFDQPKRIANLPNDGYLSLSLAPALAVLAVASRRVRRRFVEYLSMQIDLLASELGRTLQLPESSRRVMLGFLRANTALRTQLQEANPDTPEAPEAPEVEAWLGLRSGPASSTHTELLTQ
jgi:Fe-S-cluster containining protein